VIPSFCLFPTNLKNPILEPFFFSIYNTNSQTTKNQKKKKSQETKILKSSSLFNKNSTLRSQNQETRDPHFRTSHIKPRKLDPYPSPIKEQKNNSTLKLASQAKYNVARKGKRKGVKEMFLVSSSLKDAHYQEIQHGKEILRGKVSVVAAVRTLTPCEFVEYSKTKAHDKPYNLSLLLFKIFYHHHLFLQSFLWDLHKSLVH
jgi:hypothetical protein